MKYIKPRRQEYNTYFQAPQDVLELNKIFNDNNYKLYIVGGALRDYFNNEEPKDYDLCTDAIPDEVIRILSPHYKVQLQGEAFGVVVVYTKSEPMGMEIATFRKDISKGRNPEVKIGGVTIEEDSQRRDLTFNALFYDLETKKVIDVVGGKKDLDNKIVRMVGDPMVRIEEDPLRVLRVFRFSSRYGSTIDNKTKEAIHKYNDISSVSMERIWDSVNGEFMKSFKQAKDFQQYLDFITEFKLWGQILPGLKINPKIDNQDSITLVLSQITKGNDVNEISKVFGKCSIPTEITSKVLFLHSLDSFDPKKVLDVYKSKVRSKVDNKTIETWVNIKKLDNMISKFIDYKPSIKSEDVMKKFNLKPSRELGDKIKELESIKFLNT